MVIIFSLGFIGVFEAIKNAPALEILNNKTFDSIILSLILLIALFFMIKFYIQDLLRDDWVMVLNKTEDDTPLKYKDVTKYNKSKIFLKLKFRELTKDDYKKYPAIKNEEMSKTDAANIHRFNKKLKQKKV